MLFSFSIWQYFFTFIIIRTLKFDSLKLVLPQPTQMLPKSPIMSITLWTLRLQSKLLSTIITNSNFTLVAFLCRIRFQNIQTYNAFQIIHTIIFLFLRNHIYGQGCWEGFIIIFLCSVLLDLFQEGYYFGYMGGLGWWWFTNCIVDVFLGGG